MGTHGETSIVRPGVESYASVPLCVDLEGALLRGHLRGERLALRMRNGVARALGAFFWLMRITLRFSPERPDTAEIDLASLPLHEEFLSWLRAERAAGRRIFLCARRSHRSLEALTRRAGVFEDIIVDTSPQARGSDRAAMLATRFGAQGFDYAAHDIEDLSIWHVARGAVLVGPTRELAGRLSQVENVQRVFTREHAGLRVWFRAMRVHQWAKNLLVFVPAVAAHRILEPEVLAASLVAFVCFSLCASGAYLINDLTDLEADRAHPRKRLRPLASGEASLASATVIAPGLILAAVGIAWLASGPPFAAMVGLYLLVTTLYSATLKRIAMVDVLTLGGLYSLRILAGSVVTRIVPSFWLLALSMFLFFSLAVAKRYMELVVMRQSGRHEAAGRGYTTDDLTLLSSVGVASGLLSVLVLALYISGASQGLYSKDYVLWLICPLLLYWICRIWLKTHRGQLNDDPLVFALTDRPSLIAGAACLLLGWWAT